MINQSKIIQNIKQIVKEQLSEDCTGHDWWHTERVYKVAKLIAKKENADIFIVELSSLLHDIADWKFNDGNEDAGPEIAENFLLGEGLDLKTVAKITNIIKNVSFKGNNVKPGILDLEGKIVQDADRIDAIGAIGIARAFAYGGYRGNRIYDPCIESKIHNTFEEYKNSESTTINHFYEKLLLLKDLMNTKTGKAIAERRHRFMKKYLETFFNEWNVEI